MLTAVSDQLKKLTAQSHNEKNIPYPRKATEGIKPPFGGGGDGDGFDGSTVAATIFAITDSLPGKSVGEAVQTITEKEIKSEVEVSKQPTLPSKGVYAGIPRASVFACLARRKTELYSCNRSR